VIQGIGATQHTDEVVDVAFTFSDYSDFFGISCHKVTRIDAKARASVTYPGCPPAAGNCRMALEEAKNWIRKYTDVPSLENYGT